VAYWRVVIFDAADVAFARVSGWEFQPSLRDFGYLFKAPSTSCWANFMPSLRDLGVSSEHQHLVLGYFHGVPTGLGVFLRSTQHFVLGYFHGVSSGLGVFLRSTQHLVLGYFRAVPTGLRVLLRSTQHLVLG